MVMIGMQCKDLFSCHKLEYVKSLSLGCTKLTFFCLLLFWSEKHCSRVRATYCSSITLCGIEMWWYQPENLAPQAV